MSSSLLAQEPAPIPHERPPSLEAQQETAAPAASPVPEVPAAPVVPLPRDRPISTEPAAAAPEADARAPEHAIEDAGGPAAPRVYQTACPAVLLGQVEATALPPITDRQCREQSPLEVSGILVNGRMVPLSAAATLDCNVAGVMPGWVSDVDSYVRAHDNTGIESVIIGTSYMCRNVNNATGGNLSFHAFADAIDVVGFRLEDGRTVTVEQAWNGTVAQGRRIVRFAHDAACTHFTTTLGPDANALHHDHLHLDLGCHGDRCVARLCE